MRRHGITLRHTLLAAQRSYKPDTLNEHSQAVSTHAMTSLIMEMFDVPWSEETYETIAEVIIRELSLETGIAVVNAAVRRADEKTAKEKS
jgi:hypothetical protein